MKQCKAADSSTRVHEAILSSSLNIEEIGHHEQTNKLTNLVTDLYSVLVI